IALEHRNRAVIAVDRTGNGDRPFRHQDAAALVHGDFEMIGDDAELVHRHVEHRAGIDRHRFSPVWSTDPRTAGCRYPPAFWRYPGDGRSLPICPPQAANTA